MTKKENILFIIPAQYGYHTDPYEYCECLVEKYNVFYVGLDNNKPKRISDKVNVYSLIPNQYIIWRLTLFLFVLKLIRKQHFKKVFIYSFPLCSLFLLIVPRQIMIMDIRTSFIEGKYKTKLLNLLLRIESSFFKHISVISDGVVDFLHLNKSKCKLLPLGGKDVGFCERSDNTLALLYVGTFYDRYIEKTVEGLAVFFKQNPGVIVRYTIIGMGTDEEKQRILDAIRLNNIEKFVQFVGEKRHEELVPYFQTHNVGVSYIPLTDYYDCQPPTKTYEYLLNTMIVLATPTYENRKVINDLNGVLLDGDRPVDFANAVTKLLQKSGQFNMNKIYNDARQYSWQNIVEQYLLPIVNE